MKDTLFDTNVERIPEAGCWLWLGCIGNGYGKFRGMQAHRYSWLLHIGSTNGLRVLHRCDIPSCVNPAHLFLGTQSDNMLDRSIKGRHENQNTHISHCKRGHEFTEENTYLRSSGNRECRTCHRLKNSGRLL